MMAIDGGLQELRAQHPEWQPWLTVLQEILQEIGDCQWDARVPVGAESQRSKIPLLAETTLELEKTSLARLFERIIRVACRSGTPKMATLEALTYAQLDVFAVFSAALNQDGQRLNEIASAAGADPEAFHGIAALFPMPFLHACNRRWARPLVATSWTEGYCPVCGAWPALAEVRGIERNRYLRCGRCGSEWQAQCLFCPYCGMTDHNQLVSLVPEQNGAKSVIDACSRCLGYVKTFTKLQGSPPARVMLDDLASVELDIAAAERGYKRLQGAGYFLNVTVSQDRVSRPFT
jgi:FdhE protein